MTNTKIIFNKNELENLYLVELKNPYEIAKIFNCEHKTIRKNLKAFNIPLRTRSEYNALSHKTYTEPNDNLLFSKASLILHTIYKCEGNTSSTAESLRFQNQDPNLIKAFYEGMIKIYKYETEMTLNFLYNFECAKSKRTVEFYDLIFKDLKNKHSHTPSNKNPIITVNAGGRYLHKLFMKNANKIFNSIPLTV